MKKVSIITVSRAEAGQKLLQFIMRRLDQSVPSGAVMRWIRTGQVRVDKGRKKPFYRLSEGQEVRIPPHDPGESTSAPTRADLEIIHSDSDMVAVNKPAGLSAHGGTGHADSVASRLKAMFAGDDFPPVLVHRLDRDTSGVILAARSYEKLRFLQVFFSDGRAGKTYLTWVHGKWPHPEVVRLEDRMEKKGEPGTEKVRTGSGKVAACEVVPIVLNNDYSLLKVVLVTGRTHQIRVQLADRGHPIVGDSKYGRVEKYGLKLHAVAVYLPELKLFAPPPWTGKWSIPPDFQG